MSERKEVTFYRGAGNHSVYELEKLMAEREECIYQMQLKLQKLQSNVDAVVRERDELKEICECHEDTLQIYGRSFSIKDAEIQRLRDLLSKAKAYIDASPCDPDITAEQTKAWLEYQDALKELGEL